MEDDLDDTVIAPVRRVGPGVPDEDDTIIRPRARPPDLVPAPSDDERAAFYRFAVNVHEPIGLDRPAYIGRRPSPPRVIRGELPRLVRVPSARGEVSGTHLELRQQGTMVIVTDLRSTNGTTVRIPGAAPTRLRQGESVVVIPGSIIEIGDGNVIEVLPMQRAHPSGRSFGEPLS